MPGYFLTSPLRSLLRNKLHSLINLVSLMLGLTVFSFVFLYAKYEFSFNRFPDGDRIHRLVIEQSGLPGGADGGYVMTPARNHALLVEEFSDEIDKVSRLFSLFVRPEMRTSDVFQELTAVDADFADVFKLDVISGDLESVLRGPGFIAIEESALSLFSEPVAVGSRIVMQGNSVAGQPARQLEYQVAAIYRLPRPFSSPVNLRMITLAHEYSMQLYPADAKGMGWDGAVRIWLTFKNGVDLDAVQARLPDFVDRTLAAQGQNLKPGDRVSNHVVYRFQPLTELRFHPIGPEASSRQADLAQVVTIGTIGVLVLLAGCSNSISLSLAAALERRRDIGIHKTVGALQRDVLVQFMTGMVLLALLALIPALALLEWLMPVFITLLRLPTGIGMSTSDVIMLSAIAAAAGLASGAYPALTLARVKPQQVLKIGAHRGQLGTQKLRALLVGFQFCFAVMLMVTTLALFMQLRVLRNQPLGFSADNMVFLINYDLKHGLSPSNALEELKKVPGVVAAASMPNPPPINMPLTVNTRKFINRAAELVEVEMQLVPIGTDVLEMLQVPLLAGRMFDAVRDVRTEQGYSDQRDEETPDIRIVLTRAATEGLGFADPALAADQYISDRVTLADGETREQSYHIIGVVEDNMMSSLRRRPGPEVYVLSSVPTNVLLQYEDSVEQDIQQNLRQVMQRVTGSPNPVIRFIEPQIAAEFTAEANQGRLMLYCAGLALFLSCVGLYGLASFTMQRNVKEVGVRKVMGATVARLIALYLLRYAKPVVVATLLASPVALYFVVQWMQRFPYQLEKHWLLPLCLAAGGTVLAIAMVTITGIVAKAARARPVESLRYE